MNRKPIKLISMLAATLLITAQLLTCVGVGSVYGDEAPAKTQTAGANSRYTMQVNEDTLGLTITDNKTGAFMESFTSYDDGLANKTWWGAMNSAVVLTLISGSDDTKQANTFNDNVTKKVTYTDTGFTAKLFWTTYKVGLTLEVSLTEDGLTVRVPDDSIKEDGDKYKIGTIALYPYMGTSYLDSKAGYILVPDGNGALIYLNDKEGRYSAGFSSMIYGSDIGFDESKVESLLWDQYKIVNSAEQVIAPVFGIAHTDDRIAYLAVVEDGAMRASIECLPNGVSIDYNRAYAKFVERRLYTQPTSNNSTSGSLHLTESERSHSDLQVRYLFLSEDEANYAGMANAYREYLTERGILKNIDSGFKTRVDFLGSDREEWVIGTSAVVMTTVEDIREIYADLETKGVKDIFTVYKGWQKGGIYNVPVSKFKPDRKIGSANDLAELIKTGREKGIEIYLYDDALRINPDEYNVTFNVVKKINKRKYEEETYKDVYESFNWITPARSGELLDKLTAQLEKKGVDGLCIAGITSNLFSYTYSGDTYTRYDTAASYLRTAEALSASDRLVLEQPFAYLWGTTNAFLDMPMYTSSFIVEDTFVPFLSIVLKGVMPVYSEYVNFEANRQEFFLKLIETGTYPSFYITKESSAELIYTNSNDIYSSQYDAYSGAIKEYADELSAIADKTAGAVITGHDLLDGSVTRVTYSNGVRIYINYGETPAGADGVTLDAMSYAVIE
ncbi:MAG: hypothetical protein J6U61_07195 [Lachnospiraceae bacterium]|nr:hypothetical protein [Lachnospiraceae bacterium]